MIYRFNLKAEPKPTFTRSGKRLIVRDNVKRYWAYKEKLQQAMQGIEVAPMFDVIFIMPMAKSWSKKKKAAMNGRGHQQRPDRDNLLKAFQDALLIEDAHVIGGQAFKFWGYEPQIIYIPRPIVTIDEILQE